MPDRTTQDDHVRPAPGVPSAPVGPPRRRRKRSSALDDVDERLVWELVRDARTSISRLAARTGLAPSTVHARVRALVGAGVLRSFHAHVDLEALGLPLQAMINVRLREDARADGRGFGVRVVRRAPVLHVYQLGGPDDYLVHVACASPGHLRDLVEDLTADPAVSSASASIVYEHLVAAEHMDHLDGLEQMRTSIA
ncbi:Lrp/AsnC family transcriptional regulator [Nocardioides sp. GY 10127]|uniref:Lrp/AsnC family transcriptional regulator n=1 Tax=Nocardioides sp. GY 10127 TaxID=2569762 RepID=UPI00197CCAEE|nr:Lrp/AsnC family transcriptional regulator [Nocardioides sp. GY 10127]